MIRVKVRQELKNILSRAVIEYEVEAETLEQVKELLAAVGNAEMKVS